MFIVRYYQSGMVIPYLCIIYDRDNQVNIGKKCRELAITCNILVLVYSGSKSKYRNLQLVILYEYILRNIYKKFFPLSNIVFIAEFKW